MKKRLVKWAKVLGVVVLVLFLTLFGFAGLYAFEKPGVPVDYSSLMNELARAAQPGLETEPNRFEFLKTLVEDARAVRESVIADDEFYVPEILAYRGVEDLAWNYAEPTAELYEEHVAQARRHVAALRDNGVFERLEELPSIRHAYADIANPGEVWYMTGHLDSLLPLLGEIQRLSITLVSFAVDIARNGEIENAIDLLEQTKALARITSYQVFPIAVLFGESIDQLVIEHVMILLFERRLDEMQIDHLERMLDGQRLASWEYTLDHERLYRDDMLQRIFTDDGHGDGIVAMSAMDGAGFGGTPFGFLPSFTIFNVAGLALPSRREFASMIDAYENALHESMADFHRPIPDFRDFYKLESQGFFHIPFATQFVGLGSNHIEIHRKRIATEHGLRIALALEAFFNDADTYPDSLSELVPKYLDELPVDPWNPGHSLTYRPPAEGEAYYTLYSFGFNAIDENGEGDDHRLSPPWRLIEN